MPDLQTYLSALVQRGGSDLHLVANHVPRVRVDGRLLPLDEPALSAADIERLLKETGSDTQALSTGRPTTGRQDRDFTLHLESLGRFRCHRYTQRGMPALVIRFIPHQIPSLKTLGLPQTLGELTKKSQGLIMIAGPHGSGKTTTLAALIDKLNDERRAHILTLEQPIEFLHSDKKALVTQCEIGVDLPNLPTALDAVSRQDADVVMIGTGTNRQAFEATLDLAESGTLVFLTMQSTSCLLTLQCLVQDFPVDQQPLIRHRLAMLLEGVLVQTLNPRAKASGRVLALEILIPTPAIRGLIREDKIRQIYSIMQTGQAKHGMQTMNQALTDLYRRRQITSSVALAQSTVPDELRQMLHRSDARLRG